MTPWIVQRRRFMRPDAARYLRPDAARFRAPERKWDGQPRVEAEGPERGQYTFGSQFDGVSPDSGLPRVKIDTPNETGDSGEGDDGDAGGDGNALDNLLLVSATSPGFGDNGGPSLDDPPEIPDQKPAEGSDRTAFARGAAQWIGAALGSGATVAASAFIGLLNNIEWLESYNASINSYRDPPRTLEELQAGVGKRRPGYEDHHIIEKTAAERWGLSRSEINDKSNLVSIPRLKHYQITGWFQKPNKYYGGLSPRQYLSDKGVAERRTVGLHALELYKVLKP